MYEEEGGSRTAGERIAGGLALPIRGGGEAGAVEGRVGEMGWRENGNSERWRGRDG